MSVVERKKKLLLLASIQWKPSIIPGCSGMYTVQSREWIHAPAWLLSAQWVEGLVHANGSWILLVDTVSMSVQLAYICARFWGGMASFHITVVHKLTVLYRSLSSSSWLFLSFCLFFFLFPNRNTKHTFLHHWHHFYKSQCRGGQWGAAVETRKKQLPV